MTIQREPVRPSSAAVSASEPAPAGVESPEIGSDAHRGAEADTVESATAKFQAAAQVMARYRDLTSGSAVDGER